MTYMRDSTGKRLDSVEVGQAELLRRAMYRQASLFKGYSIVADLNRPFYSMITEPFDAGVSQMAIKRHIAVCDFIDPIIVYANWKGASITTSGPNLNPIYVRTGFGVIPDGDVFQATFADGSLKEQMLGTGGGFAHTDPIMGARGIAGQPFKLGTFVRVDTVTATVTTASGSNSLTALASVVGTFYPGQFIFGTGIPAGAIINTIVGTTITIVNSSGAALNATANGTTIAVTAYGKWGWHAKGYDGDGDRFTNSGSGSTTLTTDRTADSTLLSWGAKNTNTGFGPALILGRTARSRPIRAIGGRTDSIGSGAHDDNPVTPTNTGSKQRLAWVERTWGDDGIAILGTGGAQKSDATNANSTAASALYPNHLQRFMGGCTGIVFQDGTNDLANNIGLATFQARCIKDWRKSVGERGNPGFQATILPRVLPNGDLGTDAAQTLNAFSPTIVQGDDWMRDGAPLDASLAPVAIGVTGASVYRCAYIYWDGSKVVVVPGNTTDTTLHPLAKGGIFEITDAVETSRNAGKWARQWEGTGDVTSGSATVTNVVTTAGTFVDGKLVTGTGAALGSSFTGTKSGTTITLSANATATGTGVHLAQPLTDDGIHPLSAGHDKIVAWLNQAGTNGVSIRSLIRDSCNVAQ